MSARVKPRATGRVGRARRAPLGELDRRCARHLRFVTPRTTWRRIRSGERRGLQNRQRACESRRGWVRFPHASANATIFDLRLMTIAALFSPNQKSKIANQKLMRDWIALNMTPGVGPRAAAKLLER